MNIDLTIVKNTNTCRSRTTKHLSMAYGKRARKKVQKTKLPQDYLVYKHKRLLPKKLLKVPKNVLHTYCNSLNKN